MPFKAGESNYKIEMPWVSGLGKTYLRTLSPALAKKLNLRTKKGREFALLCERLAMMPESDLEKLYKFIDSLKF